MATPGKAARGPVSFKTKTKPTPAKKKIRHNGEEIRKTLQEIISLTQCKNHPMSTPSANANRPITRSNKKKPVPIQTIDLSGSPTLRGKKRPISGDEDQDQPLPKKMAEDRILDAIKVVSTSVAAMETRMKTFSTKADIDGLVEQIKDVKERVHVNSHNIERLFELRKTDHDNILKKVEQIVDTKVTSHNGQPGGSSEKLRAEHELQFLLSRRSIRVWPVSEVNDLEMSVRALMKRYLKIPAHIADGLDIEETKRVIQPRRSKISKEVLVRFSSSQSRDVAQSYAANLADFTGTAGLRLDVPDYLRGLFRKFESHGAALRSKYGAVKRSIRFDDENRSLFMDVKLENTQWHRLSALDMKSTVTMSLPGTREPTTDAQKRERQLVLLREGDGGETDAE